MIEQKFSKKPARSLALQRLMARRAHQKSVRRGQALIEMSMVVIVLLFLTMGLIQYGLIANAKLTLTNIAREGARFAAVRGTDESGGTTSDQKIRNRIAQVAANTTLTDMNTTTDVTITPDKDTRAKGELMTVAVRYDMKKKFFLPSGFPGLAAFANPTEVSASMVLE